MITDGVSCKGSYHEINQDSFICDAIHNGYILALSDGMGSKKFSQYGSKVICEILKYEFEKEELPLEQIDWIPFLERCHKKWTEDVRKYEVAQCYATMLVLLVQGNYLKAARLGDGFLSVLIDDTAYILMDQKTGYFINETDCLMEVFDEEHLEILEKKFEKFSGAVACSDGIEIGAMEPEEISCFVRDFLGEYSKMSALAGKQEIEGWAASWPGTDDKTIAYMIEGVE